MILHLLACLLRLHGSAIATSALQHRQPIVCSCDPVLAIMRFLFFAVLFLNTVFIQCQSNLPDSDLPDTVSENETPNLPDETNQTETSSNSTGSTLSPSTGDVPQSNQSEITTEVPTGQLTVRPVDHKEHEHGSGHDNSRTIFTRVESSFSDFISHRLWPYMGIAL